MSTESGKHRGVSAAVAVSIACLSLVSGCKSSGTSTGAAGQATGGNPSATGGATAGAGSTAAAGGSGNVPSTCPTAAVVSAALGSTMPAPVQNGTAATGLVCNYSDPSTGANLVLTLTPLPPTSATATIFKTVADTQAQAQGVTASSVSGLGNAAYTFTMKDASTNSSGVATTVLIVLDGTTDIDISAQSPADKVEALAHTLIGS